MAGALVPADDLEAARSEKRGRGCCRLPTVRAPRRRLGQTLVQDSYGTSMLVSPARTMVGFVEFNRVYIARLPDSVASDSTPSTALNVFATLTSRSDVSAHLVGIYGIIALSGKTRRSSVSVRG